MFDLCMTRSVDSAARMEYDLGYNSYDVHIIIDTEWFKSSTTYIRIGNEKRQ